MHIKTLTAGDVDEEVFILISPISFFGGWMRESGGEGVLTFLWSSPQYKLSYKEELITASHQIESLISSFFPVLGGVMKRRVWRGGGAPG